MNECVFSSELDSDEAAAGAAVLEFGDIFICNCPRDGNWFWCVLYAFKGAKMGCVNCLEGIVEDVNCLEGIVEDSFEDAPLEPWTEVISRSKSP